MAGERSHGLPARSRRLKETFDSQRDVVKNERRQNYENAPYGPRVEGASARRSTRPTTRTTTSDRLDGGSRRRDGRGRARRSSAPTTSRTTPRSSSPATSIAPRPRSWSSSTSARSRAAGTDPAPARRPAVAARPEAHRDGGEGPAAPALCHLAVARRNFAPGDRELDVLANVLGNGKSSRLYKRLVYDLKIAQSVSASSRASCSPALRDHAPRPCPATRWTRSLAVIDEESGGAAGQASRRAPSWSARRTRSSRRRCAASRACGARRAAAALQLPGGDAGFLAEDLRRYRAVDARGRAAGRAAVAEERTGAWSSPSIPIPMRPSWGEW